MIVSPPRHHHQTPLFLLNKIHRLISPIHQLDEHCYCYVLIGILAIFIATFSTGIDSKCFQLRKGDKAAEEDDAPYGFWGLQQSRNGLEIALCVIGLACLPKVGASELGKGRALIGT
ncbi:hypothetical protein P8452_18672 [Trifolium repens]|nr:hypothetical protein P8452_18672 [Trifolium repens]